MVTIFDYRRSRYYHRELKNVKSSENPEGDGIMIGHPQMGELEIPQNVAIEMFTNYLQEHGFKVIDARCN